MLVSILEKFGEINFVAWGITLLLGACKVNAPVIEFPLVVFKETTI